MLAVIVAFPAAAQNYGGQTYGNQNYGGQNYGGTNFGSLVYPSHDCGGAPLAPHRPADMRSVRTVEAYNREVDDYNSRLQVYAACIEAYVERARNDVERIRQRAAEASDTLNAARQKIGREHV